MKLHSIIENDEYAGLEDADKFGDQPLGDCTQCDREIPTDTDGVWHCHHCDNVAHFSCAMPSQSDIIIYDDDDEGTVSSGWYFQRQNQSGIPFRTNHNILRGVRVLAASRAYDK